MKTRKFFLISISAVLLGLVSHFAALKYEIRALEFQNLARKPIVADLPRLEAGKVASRRHSVVAFRIGMAACMVSMVFLFVSRRQDEPAPRIIVFLLLACYGALQFAVI